MTITLEGIAIAAVATGIAVAYIVLAVKARKEEAGQILTGIFKKNSPTTL